MPLLFMSCLHPGPLYNSRKTKQTDPWPLPPWQVHVCIFTYIRVKICRNHSSRNFSTAKTTWISFPSLVLFMCLQLLKTSERLWCWKMQAVKFKRSCRALQSLEFLAASAASMCSAPFSPFLLYKLRFGATSDVEVQKWSFLRKKVSV